MVLSFDGLLISCYAKFNVGHRLQPSGPLLPVSGRREDYLSEPVETRQKQAMTIVRPLRKSSGWFLGLQTLRPGV